MPISCFLEDVDPLFKILKTLLDGSSGCVGPRLFGPRLFQHVQHFEFTYCEVFGNYIQNLKMSCVIWNILASQKINQIGSGSYGHVRNAEIMNMRGLRVLPYEIEKSFVQNEAE